MTERTVKARRVDTVNGLDLWQGGDGAVFVTNAGDRTPIGSAWGPAADNTGNWFAWRAGRDPQRFESRAVALEFLTAVDGAVL